MNMKRGVLVRFGNFGVNPKLKAVVSIVFPGQQAVLARFTPFAAKPADDDAPF